MCCIACSRRKRFNAQITLISDWFTHALLQAFWKGFQYYCGRRSGKDSSEKMNTNVLLPMDCAVARIMFGIFFDLAYTCRYRNVCCSSAWSKDVQWLLLRTFHVCGIDFLEVYDDNVWGSHFEDDKGNIFEVDEPAAREEIGQNWMKHEVWIVLKMFLATKCVSNGWNWPENEAWGSQGVRKNNVGFFQMRLLDRKSAVQDQWILSIWALGNIDVWGKLYCPLECKQLRVNWIRAISACFSMESPVQGVC